MCIKYYTQKKPPWHAVIFILRKMESTSDVNRGPEPCPRLTFPVLINMPSQIDGPGVCACAWRPLPYTFRSLHKPGSGYYWNRFRYLVYSGLAQARPELKRLAANRMSRKPDCYKSTSQLQTVHHNNNIDVDDGYLNNGHSSWRNTVKFCSVNSIR